MATNTELKNQIDLDITNKISSNSITPTNVGNNIKSIIDYVDQEINTIELIPGPQGPVGPQGIQGEQGPAGTIPVKISQQINVTTGEPEINAIDYVRIFANDEYQSCKLTGPHAVGKEIYIKNTTAFNVVINGIVENINGNSNLTLPPNTYWHLIKEDGGTNSITAFKLSLT